MINIAITTTNFQDKDKNGEAPCGMKKTFTWDKQAANSCPAFRDSSGNIMRAVESSALALVSALALALDRIALVSVLILALDCTTNIISTGQIIWQDRLLVRQASVLLKTTAMSQLLCKLSRLHVWSKSSVCTCVSTPQVFIRQSRRLPKIPTLVA